MARWSLLFCLLLALFVKRGSGKQTDWEILAHLYLACDGANWSVQDNWLTDFDTVCTWYGVTCDSDNQVVELELQDNALQGTLPDHLFYMSALKVLDIRYNTKLSVDFVSIDEQPTGLEELYISDIESDAFDGVGILADSLEVFVARGVGLTGAIPSEVMSLTSLTTLDLAMNFISGKFPDSLNRLSRLTSLFLTDNMIEGRLPSSLGSLQTISQLALDLNLLTGPLPSELSHLKSLTYFTVNDQTINGEGGVTGPMPDFSAAPFLYTLDVANNHITGTVPRNFLEAVDPAMGSFMNIDMSGNDIVGTVPSELSRFGEIRILMIQNAIEMISTNLCFQDGWFSGEVGQFGCDAILCPPGTFSTFGRQISSGFPCAPCAPGFVSNFYGSTICNETDSRVGEPDQVDEEPDEETSSNDVRLKEWATEVNMTFDWLSHAIKQAKNATDVN